MATLAYSASLARVAQYRAQDMLNRNYFSHYDPSTGQLAFVGLLRLWGIPYSTAGENIAWSTNPSMVGINKDKKDFGITFGKWGAPQGPYFFVPLWGPTTLRDGTGTVVRFFISPLGYIPDVAVRNTIYGVGYVDGRAQALSAESVLDTAALDRYRFLRNAYLKNRRYQVYEGKPPPEEDEEEPAPGAAPGAPPPK